VLDIYVRPFPLERGYTLYSRLKIVVSPAFTFEGYFLGLGFAMESRGALR
jgi:hypothetical protein